MLKRTSSRSSPRVAGHRRARRPPRGPCARRCTATRSREEQAVRAALRDSAVARRCSKAVRDVVAVYEAVVRHYPASGYSDNALWQAGRLALDAFARFGERPDRGARRAAASPARRRVIRRASSSRQMPAAGRALRRAAAQLRRRSLPTRAAAVRSRDRPSRRVPPCPGHAPPRDRSATIRRAVLPDAVRMTIELDGEVPFHDERIGDPTARVPRPAVNARGRAARRSARCASTATPTSSARSASGDIPNNTTRIVLDAGGVSSYSVYPLYSPYRLVIDCLRATPAAAVTVAAKPRRAAAARAGVCRRDWRTPAAGDAGVASRPARVARRSAGALYAVHPHPRAARAPSRRAIARRLSAAARAARALASLAAPPASRATSPRRRVPPAPTRARRSRHRRRTGRRLLDRRQLGLGVSRIVIDPGHGGHDPGAQGKGVNEAELVLDVALRLEKLLAERCPASR